MPRFLMEHFSEPEVYKYRIGNWVFNPSPSWYSDDMEAEIREYGVRFIAWWVHPSLQKYTWWGGETVELGNEPWTQIRKPIGYLDSVFDLTVDHVDELLELKQEAQRILKELSGEDEEVEWFVHLPNTPLFSSLHINFASKRFWEALQQRKGVRTSVSMDIIIEQLLSGRIEVRFTSCGDNLLYHVHNGNYQ
eukprot:TRINITY_DN1877_c0_g1_i2.p1 TRINITY_DN1877_c0_g1~~TRINITY_DN1877_c0_g1_i2.p1  ORF type:complete len:192 (+),score=42.11 TRINITY_DN1877_c0_g1_i2:571-1146(+)